MLYIHSSGGDGDIANAIVDYIENCGKKISIVVFGRCESAATYIVKACHKRYALKRSIFMFHLPELTNKRILNKFRQNKKLNLHIDICKRLFHDVLEVNNKLQVFTAQEVKNMGLIDEII
ncbi:MAG: ATP-dependent Clp protease proteolytic subunit [Candidatus Gastranaerophilaceae bacterium]